MKVLIVDSSEEIIGRLHEMLSELDIIRKIYKAKTCSDAITEVKKNMPDIILLDINLHNYISFKCATQILHYHKETTIIALASNSGKIDKLQSQKLRIEFFFDKYNEFEKIPQAIQDIAKKHKEK